MNNIPAGLLSAVPLSILGIVYMLLRGRALVALIQADSTETAMNNQTWFYLMLGTMAIAPFVLGLAASLAYGWAGRPETFRMLALGLGVLLSALAVISHTPMPFDKIAMNLAVALDFGLLLPLLSSG